MAFRLCSGEPRRFRFGQAFKRIFNALSNMPAKTRMSASPACQSSRKPTGGRRRAKQAQATARVDIDSRGPHPRSANDTGSLQQAERARGLDTIQSTEKHSACNDDERARSRNTAMYYVVGKKVLESKAAVVDEVGQSQAKQQKSLGRWRWMGEEVIDGIRLHNTLRRCGYPAFRCVQPTMAHGCCPETFR